MKRLALAIVIAVMSFAGADACTNFPINVGVVDSPEGRVISEIVSVLINERTGVTVGLKYFKNSKELYKKVAEGKLEILIEDTSNALRFMKMPVSSDPQANLATVKEIYKNKKKYFWLKPFAFSRKDSDGGDTLTSLLISRKALDEFPALARVVGKLSKIIDDKALARMVGRIKAKDDAKKIAHDFLAAQKLI